jgi:hypothetical protein
MYDSEAVVSPELRPLQRRTIDVLSDVDPGVCETLEEVASHEALEPINKRAPTSRLTLPSSRPAGTQ